MSSSHRGEPLSIEHRASISEGLRGRMRTEQSKAKTSASLSAYHARKKLEGYNRSPESRIKTSISLKIYFEQQREKEVMNQQISDSTI